MAPSNASKKVDNRPREGFRFDALIVGSVIGATAVYISDQYDFVHNFNLDSFSFVKEYSVILPASAIVWYLTFVHLFGPYFNKNLRPESPAFDAFLKRVLQAWNLFLALLSITMLIGIGTTIVPSMFVYNHETLEKLICDPNGTRWNGVAFFWMMMFNFSKFAELFDTVLLVLRNRPVPFLHWYHHWTVLAYTWFAVYTGYSVGWFFGWVNCGVHTIMYWYYYRSACGIKLTYDKVITKIQITQMVIGVVINLIWFTLHQFNPISCSTVTPGYEVYNIASSCIMYGSYFYLFYTFYQARYKKAQDAKKQK